MSFMDYQSAGYSDVTPAGYSDVTPAFQPVDALAYGVAADKTNEKVNSLLRRMQAATSNSTNNNTGSIFKGELGVTSSQCSAASTSPKLSSGRSSPKSLESETLDPDLRDVIRRLQEAQIRSIIRASMKSHGGTVARGGIVDTRELVL